MSPPWQGLPHLFYFKSTTSTPEFSLPPPFPASSFFTTHHFQTHSTTCTSSTVATVSHHSDTNFMAGRGLHLRCSLLYPSCLEDCLPDNRSSIRNCCVCVCARARTCKIWGNLVWDADQECALWMYPSSFYGRTLKCTLFHLEKRHSGRVLSIGEPNRSFSCLSCCFYVKCVKSVFPSLPFSRV